MNTLNVNYVSEWEWVSNGKEEWSGEVKTNAVLDLKNGFLEIETSDLDTDHLIKEYITYKNVKYPAYEEDGQWRVSEDDLKDIIFEMNS